MHIHYTSITGLTALHIHIPGIAQCAVAPSLVSCIHVPGRRCSSHKKLVVRCPTVEKTITQYYNVLQIWTDRDLMSSSQCSGPVVKLKAPGYRRSLHPG